MKITCLEKQVGRLLGEAYYKIPRFQRPYSWDHINVEEFWNDTVVEGEGDYFIGNFVVYDDKGVLGVVDGQQRLTTVTLLLCALRDVFQEQGEDNLAKGLHGLIERPNIQAEKYYVLQSETSYPYFQEYIQKFQGKPAVKAEVGPEEELLKEAFDYLREKLDGVVEAIKNQPNLSAQKKRERIREELSRVRDKVLALNLIFTALDNDDDAYIIFETLNTRGKDLTVSDLVKSHLSRLMKPSNKGVDLAKDKWSKINETFEESQADLSVSTFIHHYWLSRYEYTTEKKLYKALRKQIKKENAAGFLDDLVLESGLYRSIHEPAYRKWKKEELDIRDSLAAMNLFRIKQQLPMVLAVMRHLEDEALKIKHVRSVLTAIENFHFSFTAVASQRSSGGISFMYASNARNLYSAKGSKKVSLLKDFKKKLADKRPPVAEFVARFTELKYSTVFTKQKPLVKYILSRIYEKNSPGLAIDPEKMTIEHLVPESPAKGPALADDQIASVGNLILVTHQINNKLANKTFAEKKSILKSCNVWVDEVITNAQTWGPSEIQNRATLLADDAFNNIWPL
ncbi:MAG TPA: DUF262 domain-containing HNH endonuclease family protein [Terriglobales bacterium]|jgi:uncharacterized protein with ParB-like and HNH nuclease domain